MITVAVPTYRHPDYAMDALRSLVDQRFAPAFEILVLDNACDERLAQRVRRMAERSSARVEYVGVPAIGLHRGRHEAARRALGDVLAYVDDDVIAEEGWLAGLAEAFEDPSVHLVGGRNLPLFEAEVPSWLGAFWSPGAQQCGLLTLIDLGSESKDVDPLLVWGANFAIRKATLHQVGGFHPDGFPWELCRFRGDGETAVSREIARLRLRAVYCPQATIHHRVSPDRLTEAYFKRREFLQGVSDSYFAARLSGGKPAAVPRTSRIRALASGGKAAMRSCFPVNGVPSQWRAVRERVWRTHSEGYRYHQEVLRRDESLRAWVTLPDYWTSDVSRFDGKAPSPGGTHAS